MKYQPNIPTDLYNKFIENLGYTPKDEKILVIRDIYTACYLSINNEVTFVSDDSEAISMFVNTVIVNPEFGMNDSYIFVNENTNIEWLNTIDRIVKSMKFDVAIMNPPYDKNLHLKILEKVIPISDKVVNISPIRWLQDPSYYIKKTSDVKRFTESILKHMSSLDIVRAKEANSLFTIQNFTDLGIYFIDDGGFNLDEFFKSEFGKKIDIFNKTKPYFEHDSFANHVKYNSNGICVKINDLFGGHSNPYTLVTNNHSHVYINGVAPDGRTMAQCMFKKSDCDETKEKAMIEFNSVEEGNNFIAVCKTKFMMFLNSICKRDVNVSLKTLPFLDFTKTWTNKDLCEYFEITGYIDDEHAEPDSEWEIILKTMEPCM